MPQVAHRIVKERAGRLRSAWRSGARRSSSHGHRGSVCDVLMERDGFGRTPQFAEIQLAGAASAAWRRSRPASAGHDGQRLIGEVVQRERGTGQERRGLLGRLFGGQAAEPAPSAEPAAPAELRQRARCGRAGAGSRSSARTLPARGWSSRREPAGRRLERCCGRRRRRKTRLVRPAEIGPDQDLEQADRRHYRPLYEKEARR